MNNLLDIINDYVLERSQIENCHNGRSKLGCIIYCDSFGYDIFGINQYNVDDKFSSIHAEVAAVNKLRYTVKRKTVTMIVFRTNNKGDKLMMAKPCNNCENHIKKTLKYRNYKLKGNKCWYTDLDGSFSYIKIEV